MTPSYENLHAYAPSEPVQSPTLTSDYSPVKYTTLLGVLASQFGTQMSTNSPFLRARIQNFLVPLQLPSITLLAIQYGVTLAYFVSAIFFTRTEMKRLIRE